MTLWNQTLELLKIGYISLFKKVGGEKNLSLSNIFAFIILPIIVFGGCIYSKVIIKEGLVSDIITVLSIFLGITLGVIFIVPDKLSQRLESDTSTNESDVESRLRYKRFCKLFIQRLSFVLILCVILIILSLIVELISRTAAILVSAIIIGLFVLSILSILKLIIDIYVFLMTDIEDK